MILWMRMVQAAVQHPRTKGLCCSLELACSAGVRYPAILLPEVRALLETAQAQVQAQAQFASAVAAVADIAAHASGVFRPGEAALKAAALGAGGAATRIEPVSPVIPSALAKAFRCGTSACVHCACALHLY